MSLAQMILGAITLLISITMHIKMIEYGDGVTARFEERKLELQVNYATDAAAQEMVTDSADLGQDYEDLSRLSVDPMVAIDTFATVMVKNLGLPLNNTSKQFVLLEHTPVFLVAATDGYYIATPQKINSSGSQDAVFGIKVPYTYVDGGKTYALNLSLKQAIVFENGRIYKDYNLPLTHDEQLRIINTKIADGLNDAIFEYARYSPQGYLYLPKNFTSVYSTNNVDTTTVMAYIDNFNAGLDVNIQAFGIGGTYIKNNRPVVGFIIDGKKYYSYSDETPQGVTPIEVYDTMEEAAINGYYYYLR